MSSFAILGWVFCICMSLVLVVGACLFVFASAVFFINEVWPNLTGGLTRTKLERAQRAEQEMRDRLRRP